MRPNSVRMICKMIEGKIRNQSGESLGEVLVALLVSSLALLMLAGVISTSSRIIIRNKDIINTYYENNNGMIQDKATTNTDTSINGTVTINGTVLSPVKSEINIYYYVNGTFDKKVVSYNYH